MPSNRCGVFQGFIHVKKSDLDRLSLNRDDIKRAQVAFFENLGPKSNFLTVRDRSAHLINASSFNQPFCQGDRMIILAIRKK